MTCVQLNKDGSIAASADWAFPGSTRVDYQVVRAYDGRLYKAGTEPAKPAEEVEAELFARLRAARDLKLTGHDKAVAQLTRDLRMATEEDAAAIEARLAEWDACAKALCDLPEQNGAPWDGGGEATPWPVMPGMA